MEKSIRFIITFLLCVFTQVVNAQVIHLFVSEAQTGDSIPHANAIYLAQKRSLETGANEER